MTNAISLTPPKTFSTEDLRPVTSGPGFHEDRSPFENANYAKSHQVVLCGLTVNQHGQLETLLLNDASSLGLKPRDVITYNNQTYIVLKGAQAEEEPSTTFVAMGGLVMLTGAIFGGTWAHNAMGDYVARRDFDDVSQLLQGAATLSTAAASGVFFGVLFVLLGMAFGVHSSSKEAPNET